MSLIRKLFGLGPKKNEENVTEVIVLTPTGPAPIVTKEDVVQTDAPAPIVTAVPDEKPAKVARVRKSTPRTVAKKTTRTPKQ